VRRSGAARTVTAHLAFAENLRYAITVDPHASAKAVRVRNGILTGGLAGERH
jgi:hypothetical protein